MDRKEAIGIVRRNCPNDRSQFSEALKTLIPELEEDEAHRKWILEYLYDGLHKADEQFKSEFGAAIAWFEKQKSVNPFSGTGFNHNGHHYGICARDNGIEVTKDGKIIYRSVPPFIGQSSTTEEFLRRKVDAYISALSKIALALYKSECDHTNPAEQIRTVVTDTVVEIMGIDEEQKEQNPQTV